VNRPERNIAGCIALDPARRAESGTGIFAAERNFLFRFAYCGKGACSFFSLQLFRQLDRRLHCRMAQTRKWFACCARSRRRGRPGRVKGGGGRRQKRRGRQTEFDGSCYIPEMLRFLQGRSVLTARVPGYWVLGIALGGAPVCRAENGGAVNWCAKGYSFICFRGRRRRIDEIQEQSIPSGCTADRWRHLETQMETVGC
jgi:hypothetical protein